MRPATTGPQLQKLREKAGISQVDIAKLAGVSQGSVSRFERGFEVRDSAAIRAAYAGKAAVVRPTPKAEPEPPKPPTRRRYTEGHSDGRAALARIRARVAADDDVEPDPPKPDPVDVAAPPALGKFDDAWQHSMIDAWVKGGVTICEMRSSGQPEAPARRVYMATEAQLHELGRRFTTATIRQPQRESRSRRDLQE